MKNPRFFGAQGRSPGHDYASGWLDVWDQKNSQKARLDLFEQI
jgi:hypothetical protein